MVIPPSQGHQTDHCRGGSPVRDPPLVEQAWVFWLFATKDGSRARISFCWWTMHVTPKPAQEGPDEEVATTTPPAVPQPVDPVALPPATRIGPLVTTSSTERNDGVPALSAVARAAPRRDGHQRRPSGPPRMNAASPGPTIQLSKCR
jgi:hypothetical protein